MGCEMLLSEFVRERRKVCGMTQKQLADKAGVGLRFIREMEAGKSTLRMDKVNIVLDLFGCRLEPVPVTDADSEEVNA